MVTLNSRRVWPRRGGLGIKTRQVKRIVNKLGLGNDYWRTLVVLALLLVLHPLALDGRGQESVGGAGGFRYEFD